LNFHISVTKNCDYGALKDAQFWDAECSIVKFEDGMFHRGPDSKHEMEWLNDDWDEWFHHIWTE